ncbi:hypothetical protein L1987_11062 [Smallanthus sonchifolius]|uniref:Uncharacterized protein n=1 Tax=Smallanthus sonchifolius TaxID=185202 RepID=A0ACB9JBF1_9ASTR|nr:hypothetical protein L1987_11062 [Smallanthus sonchifolius]
MDARWTDTALDKSSAFVQWVVSLKLRSGEQMDFQIYRFYYTPTHTNTHLQSKEPNRITNTCLQSSSSYFRSNSPLKSLFYSVILSLSLRIRICSFVYVVDYTYLLT